MSKLNNEQLKMVKKLVKIREQLKILNASEKDISESLKHDLEVANYPIDAIRMLCVDQIERDSLNKDFIKKILTAGQIKKCTVTQRFKILKIVGV